jgi:hypothetical protein
MQLWGLSSDTFHVRTVWLFWWRKASNGRGGDNIGKGIFLCRKGVKEGNLSSVNTCCLPGAAPNTHLFHILLINFHLISISE